MDDDTAIVTQTKDENLENDISSDEFIPGNTGDKQSEIGTGQNEFEETNQISSPIQDSSLIEEVNQVEEERNGADHTSPPLSPSLNENVSSTVDNDITLDESEKNCEGDDHKEITSETNTEAGKSCLDIESEAIEENDEENIEEASEVENDEVKEQENDKVNEEFGKDEDVKVTSQDSTENSNFRTLNNDAESIGKEDEYKNSLDEKQSVSSRDGDGSVSQDPPSETTSRRSIQGSDIESDEDLNEWDDTQSKQSIEEQKNVENFASPIRENEESMDIGDNSSGQLVKGAEEVSSEDEDETQSSKISQSELSQGNEEELDRENEGEKKGTVQNPLSPAEDISESEAGELSDEEEDEKGENEKGEWDLDLTKQGDNVPSDRLLAETEDINSPESDLQEGEKTPLQDLESAASPISEEGNLSDIDLEKRRREMYNDISDEEESFSDEEKIDKYKVDTVVRENIFSDSSAKRSEIKRDRKLDKFHNQSSMGEEQVELDYDEDVGEEDGRGHEDKDRVDDSRAGDNEGEKRETEEVRRCNRNQSR